MYYIFHFFQFLKRTRIAIRDRAVSYPVVLFHVPVVQVDLYLWVALVVLYL